MRESSANTSQSRNGIRARVSAAFAFLTACVALGIQTPFFPLFLADRGLSTGEISLALALPPVIRLVAMPLAGTLSDYWGAPRAMLVGLGTLAATGYLLVGLAPTVATIFMAIAFAVVFWTPIFPLLDAYSLRLASERVFDYGRVRLWGSVSFITANIAGGYLLNWMPLGIVVWGMAGSIFLFAVSSRALPRYERAAPHERKQRLKRPSAILLLGVFAAACVQASHALFYGFSSLDWQSKGIEPGNIGILWALGTGAEVVLFYVATHISTRFSALGLIATGGLMAFLRFGAFAFDPPPSLIAPLQMLHAFTFGATHLGLMGLLGLHMPAHSAGRAQTYASTVLGAVMALAMLSAGWLYVRFGVAAYGAFALLGGFGGLIAFFAYLQPQSSGLGGKTRAPS
jgi:PPP family 3-phenylpropionic acid transporter